MPLGESALISHEKSSKHSINVKVKQGSNLSDFGFGPSSNPGSKEVPKKSAPSTSNLNELAVPLQSMAKKANSQFRAS